LVLAYSFIVNAQVPNKISYQGLLTKTDCSPVQDGNYDLRFRLYDAPTGRTLHHDETIIDVSIQRGSFNVILSGFSSIFDSALYVEVTALSGPGISSSITFSPCSELTNAPYSLGLQVPKTLTTSIDGGEVLKVVNNKYGTALLGEVGPWGGYGVKGISTDNGTDVAIGGQFSSSGTGEA